MQSPYPNFTPGMPGWIQAGHRNCRPALMPIQHPTQNRSFVTVIAAIDIQKALDTMRHDGLRLKLAKLDFSINLTRWISSFLTARKAKVKFNGTLSSNINMESCAPQGSIIGTMLYQIYVHDIPQLERDDVGLAQFVNVPVCGLLLQ